MHGYILTHPRLKKENLPAVSSKQMGVISASAIFHCGGYTTTFFFKDIMHFKVDNSNTVIK